MELLDSDQMAPPIFGVWGFQQTLKGMTGILLSALRCLAYSLPFVPALPRQIAIAAIVVLTTIVAEYEMHSRLGSSWERAAKSYFGT